MIKWYSTVTCPHCTTQWTFTPNNPCCIRCGYDMEEGKEDVQVQE